MKNLNLNIMKKLMLSILAVFTLFATSCSSDDDATPPQDPFIGTWTLNKEIENGEEYIIEECYDKEVWLINPNGNHTISSFDYINDDPATCGVYDVISDRKWENLGEGKYKFTRNVGTEYEDTEEYTLIFNGNTLSATDNRYPNYSSIFIKS